MLDISKWHDHGGDVCATRFEFIQKVKGCFMGSGQARRKYTKEELNDCMFLLLWLMPGRLLLWMRATCCWYVASAAAATAGKWSFVLVVFVVLLLKMSTVMSSIVKKEEVIVLLGSVAQVLIMECF